MPDNAVQMFKDAVNAALRAVDAAIRKETPPRQDGAAAAHYELYAPILLPLSVYVERLNSLPPSLAGGLPAIDSGSTPDDIAKANAAASNAFDFLVESRELDGTRLNFTVDNNHVEGMPSKAYFVLHHGDFNRVNHTTTTTEITKRYNIWLKEANFA